MMTFHPTQNSHRGIHPPPPSSFYSTSTSTTREKERPEEEGYGGRLLRLIRRYEQLVKTPTTTTEKEEEHDQQYDTTVEELLTVLDYLRGMYFRRGLLQGNIENAERILASSNDDNTNHNTNNNNNTMIGGNHGGGKSKKGRTNRNNKRNKTKHGSNTEDGIVSFQEEQQQQQVSIVDESLIIVAIVRILTSLGGGGGGKREAVEQDFSEDENNDPAILVSLAAEVGVAISHYIKVVNETNNTTAQTSTCILAEYQLLAQSGKPILTSLVQILQQQSISIHSNSNNNTRNGKSTKKKKGKSSDVICLTVVSEDDTNENDDATKTRIQQLHSVLKLCCSLLGLFGTKLSRSTKLIQDLYTVCYGPLLTLNNDRIQDSVCRVLATIPFTGVNIHFHPGTTMDDTGTLVSTTTTTTTNSRTTATPSEIWNTMLGSTIASLSTVLQTMVPLTTTTSNNGAADDHINSNNNSSSSTVMLERWMHYVRRDIVVENNNNEQQLQLQCFDRMCSGLMKLIQHLLLPDGSCVMNQNSNHSTSNTVIVMMDGQVNIQQIITLVELCFSFPVTAETVYYRTKKRLRDEKLVTNDGHGGSGFFSIKVVVTQMANTIKLLGHTLLECVLAAVASAPTVLFPYGKRLLQLSYASIVTSCSGPVRTVIDPTTAAQLDGTTTSVKQQRRTRWLHLSIVTRMVTIQTFTKIISAFGGSGCGSSSSSSGSYNTDGSSQSSSVFVPTTDTDKAISLVVGCLVEQISSNFKTTDDTNTNTDDVDWGTNKERINLVVASIKCLSTTIVSCGGYLPMPVRSLIESVVMKGLSHMAGRGDENGFSSSSSNNSSIITTMNSQILSWSPVQVAFIKLACTCVTTPWNDGASSSSNTLLNLLRIVGNKFKNDAGTTSNINDNNNTDDEISFHASIAIRLCDTIAVPRAPALTYIARGVVAATPASNPNNGSTIDDVAGGPPPPHQMMTTATLSSSDDAALSLAINIESARNEAIRERKRIEEIEKLALEEKNRRKEEKKRKEKSYQQEKDAAAAAATRKRQKSSSTAITTEKKKHTVIEQSIQEDESAIDDTKTGIASKTDDNNSNDVEMDNNDERNTKKCDADEEKDDNNQAFEDGNDDGDGDDEAFPHIFDGDPDTSDEE